MPRPNLLVILCDQLKATASHLYGNPFCQTPALERLSHEGVLYRHAFTPHPLCVPARVSLWTGQYPHAHGARRNETLMPADAQHAFKTWKAQGYRLGLIGKNHCFAAPTDLALFDVWCELSHGGIPRDAQAVGMRWVRPTEAIQRTHSVRQRMPEVSPRFSYAVTDHPLEDYGTSVIAAQTVRFLEEHRAAADDAPFALWVSFPDPHEPYETPRRYWEQFPRGVFPAYPAMPSDGAPERNRVLYQMMGMEDDAPEDVHGVLAAYYGNVRFLDDGLARILDALERLNLREDTIVVFTADHGDFAGEQGMTCKGGVFYDALTHVPLVVSWPGHLPEGQADESMASLVDIAPTLLHLQELPVPSAMQGHPLPTVTHTPPRDAAFAEYGAGGPPFRLEHLHALPIPCGRAALMRSLQWREAEGRRKMARTRRWKYVHDPMGDLDELYDLQRDPWELSNLAPDPAYAAPLASMRLRLADWSILTEDAREVPLPDAERYRL